VPTLRALEQGKGTVSVSVLMNALWCLNQYKGIADVCREAEPAGGSPVDAKWKDI